MNDLKGKRILFFAPSFFGYELAISQKLKDLGAEVDYYDERPQNNFIVKAIIRVNKKLLKNKILSYYRAIIKETKQTTYDYVFVVNIEAMLPTVLEELKQQQGQAKFILYMWDSLQNKKRTLELLPYFDSVSSFDRTDAERIANVKFRPLFFIDEYAKIADQASKDGVGLCFIGTMHSDRYQLIEKIKRQIDSYSLNSDFFMYFPSPLLFFYKKIRDSKFSGARYKDFHFKALSQYDILQRIGEASIVLDIQHPAQTGLTMRTIEMLGANKKLITTNTYIKEYDFYDDKNILVVDRDNPFIDKSFFESNYSPLSPSIKYKYSIEGWLKELFLL